MPSAASKRSATTLLTAVEADGLVARLGREVFRLGDVPEQDAIDQRVRELSSAGQISAGDRLPLRRHARARSARLSARERSCPADRPPGHVSGLVPSTSSQHRPLGWRVDCAGPQGRVRAAASSRLVQGVRRERHRPQPDVVRSRSECGRPSASRPAIRAQRVGLPAARDSGHHRSADGSGEPPLAVTSDRRRDTIPLDVAPIRPTVPRPRPLQTDQRRIRTPQGRPRAAGHRRPARAGDVLSRRSVRQRVPPRRRRIRGAPPRFHATIWFRVSPMASSRRSGIR